MNSFLKLLVFLLIFNPISLFSIYNGTPIDTPPSYPVVNIITVKDGISKLSTGQIIRDNLLLTTSHGFLPYIGPVKTQKKNGKTIFKYGLIDNKTKETVVDENRVSIVIRLYCNIKGKRTIANVTTKIYSRIVLHPKFDPKERRLSNLVDVAILQLEGSVLPSPNTACENLKLIKLSKNTSSLKKGVKVKTLGWGNNKTGSGGGTRRIGDSSVVEYGKGQLSIGITGGNIACQGDSGGPLLSSSNNYLSYGVMNYKASAACTSNVTSYYVSSEYIYDWVEHMKAILPEHF